MIDIRPLPLGALQTNCYLLICPDTKETAIIDPSDDGTRIALLAEMEQLNVTHILLTHTHFDHVGGLADLKASPIINNAPIYTHPDSVQMLELAHMAALRWHITIPECPPADKMLAEGDKLTVGNIKIEVLHTPGHAPGHVTFYLPDEHVAFVGDVLFREGVGRTDLPGCNSADLVTSIKEKLYTLPAETVAYPGHGVETTIGHERKHNPFVRADA